MFLSWNFIIDHKLKYYFYSIFVSKHSFTVLNTLSLITSFGTSLNDQQFTSKYFSNFVDSSVYSEKCNLWICIQPIIWFTNAFTDNTIEPNLILFENSISSISLASNIQWAISMQTDSTSKFSNSVWSILALALAINSKIS